MFASDTAIRRPIFTIMAMSALVLFGFLAYRALGINQFPNVDFPTVSVVTVLPGASPEVVESAVTDVIENELSSIEGIKHITSTSSLGVSQISVEFELDRDIDLAAQDVRDKVAVAEADLPLDAEPPAVSKLDISAQPNMWIALMGPDARAIGEYARWTLRPRLQTIDGVGNIFLGGYQEREIRIWVDRERLEAYDLTAGELVTALQDQNVEVPGGALESGARETVVKIQGEVPTVEAFSQIVLAVREGAPIRLADVARVEDGIEPARGFARYNGQVALGLGIAPRSGANAVEVAERVRQRIAELEPSFPTGMSYRMAYDGSEYIERSIADAQLDLLYGAFFAVVVVLVFLRSWRSTLIIGLALPTSLLGTFAFMNIFGFTLNTMTVLALALAVGIVIDDAIVVLENIYRNMEAGKPPREAAAFGTDEIALAVVATTFSLAAVFLPVAFMEGIVGRFLYQFGVTVAIAILLSLFVALTLTPMLSSRFLKHEERRKNVVFAKIGEVLDWTDRRYRQGLDWALANRWKTIGLAVAVSLIGVVLFMLVPKELTPEVDESAFVVASETPTSSSVYYTDEKQKQLEAVLLEGVPELEGLFSAVGLFGPVNQGFMFVRLKPSGDRDRSQAEIMDEMRGRLNAFPGIQAYVSTLGSAFSGGSSSEPFQFVITGPELEGLDDYSETLMTRLRADVPGITDLRTDMRLQKPEVRVEVDRDKAAALGLDVAEVARVINVLIGSEEATIYKEGGHRYDVRVRVEEEQRHQPADILQLATRTGDGGLVRLDNVVSLEEATGINVINRRDRQRAITILANLQGASLGEAVGTADRVAAEILPDGYATAVAGASETFQQTFAALLFALMLATVITYMLLASQFESLVHPFTIMGAVPLASIGALGLLLVTGQSLNLYSFIGLILLIGLVVKNSILLVDYTNTLRARGVAREAALKEAGPVRLRPILMTSLTVIFGVMPIALGVSEGAELRQPMAIAVIGGLTTSTFLTLLVIPVIYSLMEDGIAWAKVRVSAVQRHGWRGAWQPAHPEQ